VSNNQGMADIPPMVSTKEVYEVLVKAGDGTHPQWRILATTHWVMSLDWYKAIRRASLPPDADDDARDETKWEPQPGDMVLGWHIRVTEDGGQPHLVDGRPAELRALIRRYDATMAG
jgi:hypothetical protein